MSNKTLFCLARNCSHNYDHECTAGYINVRGVSATNSQETTCSSFWDDSVMFLSNLIKCGDKTDPQNIKCEAKNCKYNNDRKCEADNVVINSNYFSCETFDPLK